MAQSGTSYEILSKISYILIELKLASYYERELNTPENTITYHNALVYHPKRLHKHCFQFLLGTF